MVRVLEEIQSVPRGQPFTVGSSLFAQAWYRDPAGTPTSAFTNALRWLY